jgi:molecular chaperone HscB
MLPYRIYRLYHLLPSTSRSSIGRVKVGQFSHLGSDYKRNFSNATNSSNDSTIGNNRSIHRNAFQVFSLPVSFQIDEEILRLKYHEVMKNLHPDKQRNNNNNTNTTDDDNTDAAAVTLAYDILKRPHLRAMHLLHIMKGTPKDEMHSNDDILVKDTQKPSQDFLSSVMDLQELLELLDTDEELKPYYDDNVRRMNYTYEQLEKAFDDKDIKKFQKFTTELKYWTRIDETLRKKMTSLE